MLTSAHKEILFELVREELRVIEELLTNEDDYVMEPELSELKEKKKELNNILDTL